jgi:glycine cleavage system aminomethyltransferase T
MESNIALAMVPIEYAQEGTRLKAFIHSAESTEPVDAVVHRVPFFDPDKTLPAS